MYGYKDYGTARANISEIDRLFGVTLRLVRSKGWRELESTRTGLYVYQVHE